MDKKIPILWEKRSRDYGSDIKGVLPKSFPPPVNKYLHEWMFEKIKLALSIERKIKILDVGCGYGRISEAILKRFPNSLTFGIDISKTYVSLYNKKLSPRGRAITGDIKTLPFESSSFDVCLVVTTLMYITQRADQEKVMKEIIRVLKPGGKIVIIERNPKGYYLTTLGGLVNKLRGERNKEIFAISFDARYMRSLIERCGGQIFNMHGIPIWTLLLPLSIFVSIINKKIASKILSAISSLDNIFSWVLTPSLYIAYIGRKKK